MLEGRRSFELLQVIAETLGTDIETFAALRDGAGEAFGGDTPSDHHRSMLLFWLVKAFRTLPDEGSRLQALRYVEALAAKPIQAD